MGIHHLNKILKKYSPNAFREIPLNNYAFKKVAIDISLYMFKYKTIFGDDKWLTAFISLICCFRRNEIHCVFIFDSKAPIEKEQEQKDRREQRQKIKDKAIQLEIDYNKYKETGEKSELLIETCKKSKKDSNRLLLQTDIFDEKIIKDLIDKLNLQTISIGKKDFDLAKQLFDILDVPYHQATSEAEATCAYLCKENMVYGAMSEDTDVLAYLSPKFLTKVNITRESCIEIDLKQILNDLEITSEQFRDMCIMCGNDYNKNIKGIGPQKAYELIKEYKNIENIERHTKHDTSVLKYERTRELFTFSENYFNKRILCCGTPDYKKLEEFLFENNCRIDIDYVKSANIPKELEFVD